MFLLSKTKNNFAIIIAIFFLAIVGQVFLPSMGIFFLGQWPVFILIFILNFWQKKSFPLFCALIAGALIDFISGLNFGVFTLSLFSIALIAQTAQQKFKSSSWASFGVALVICALCFFGLTHLFFYVFSII
ncbi:MAG: hypothetical protein Q7R99_00060 [bacterium]|nr:hypothetical protein [bacterium]